MLPLMQGPPLRAPAWRAPTLLAIAPTLESEVPPNPARGRAQLASTARPTTNAATRAWGGQRMRGGQRRLLRMLQALQSCHAPGSATAGTGQTARSDAGHVLRCWSLQRTLHGYRYTAITRLSHLFLSFHALSIVTLSLCPSHAHSVCCDRSQFCDRKCRHTY
jgi:hypothetical protein